MWSATRPTRPHGLPWPAAKAAIVVLGPGGLGLLPARPPDEPERAHHGNLEHDKEKKDRRESLHRRER